MTSEPSMSGREVLDRFYAAEKIYMSAPPDKADFSGIAATLSPNIKLYQSDDLPYGGTYEGQEGFLRWSKEMASRFDIVDVQPSDVLEKDDKVVVLSTVKFRVRASGEELVYPFCQVVTVDREKGQITEMRPFYWWVPFHTIFMAVSFVSGR